MSHCILFFIVYSFPLYFIGDDVHVSTQHIGSVGSKGSRFSVPGRERLKSVRQW